MESPLSSTQAKEIDQICRTCGTCTRVKPGRYSLRHPIPLDIGPPKTYGELLSNLLKINLAMETENIMPQRLCIKCANLLKNVYMFILEARKLHEKYSSQQWYLENVLKNQDCLQEIPIDFPKGSQIVVDIKTEPQPSMNLLNSEYVETGVKLEQSNANAKKGEETKNSDEHALNDVVVKFEHNGEGKSSRVVGENIKKNIVNNSQQSDDNQGCNLPIADGEYTKETNDSKESIQRHLAVRCDLCDKIYINYKAFATHKTYAHMTDEKKLRCAVCDFKTSRISSLKVHLTTIHGPECVEKYIKPKNDRVRNFGCDLCSRKYCRKDDLQKHVKKKHVNGSRIEKQKLRGNVEKRKDFHLCNFCGQSFTTHSSLQIHSRKHTGERPFKCDLCEKAFMRQQDMKLHRVIHSDEKPHQCFECGKSFKRSDKLRDHMRVHSELRPHKCTEYTRCRTCIKTSSSYQSLEQVINNDTDQAKTYGELVKDLLQVASGVDHVSALEDQLPQKICKKCANLLRNVYLFIVEARRRHEELLQYLCGIKSEDCLQEVSIDLPNLTEMQIKSEPEIIETPVSSLEDKSDQNCISLKPELNHDSVHETKEHSLVDCGPENLHSDASDISSVAEDDLMDFNLSPKSLAVRCDICDKVYKNAIALTAHKTFSHMPEEKKIPCALCNFKTSRTSAFKVHLRTIHGPETVDKYFKPRRVCKGSFCCTMCPKRYSRKNDLQRHIKKTHINGENSVRKAAKSGQKSKQKYRQSYLCTFCGQSFAEKYYLSIHARTHTGDSPFKCEFCEKSFKRSDSLRYHMVTHSDEKPHACSECGKSFKRKDKLRTHMRVHSELRPYKCSECEKTFKYSSVLKTHMHIHTGQTPFSCKICGENFSLRTSLNIHCAKNGHFEI
uniref:Protein krueppel n=1 Tax=Glossina pallidipes TaxID=7398 RepID=A0A1A9ZJL3_GLOPL